IANICNISSIGLFFVYHLSNDLNHPVTIKFQIMGKEAERDEIKDETHTLEDEEQEEQDELDDDDEEESSGRGEE
ncbi:MAG: hypothetical protein WA631_10755, partial [Nitrososphaeraceae archaeon]